MWQDSNSMIKIFLLTHCKIMFDLEGEKKVFCIRQQTTKSKQDDGTCEFKEA